MADSIYVQPHWPDRQPARQDVTVGELTSWLGRRSINRDALNVSKSGEDVVSPQDEARAERLVADPKFRRWLTSRATGHLLVDGGYDQASQISGLSIFCNSLREALWGNTTSCIPLMFFCGLHTGPPTFTDTQPRPGPPPPTAPIGLELETVGHTMVRSLICQLLRRRDLDRVIPISELDILPIKAGSITALCELLSYILSQMSRDVVVWCLVDGVEFCEQGRSWFDVKLVLAQLARYAKPADNTRGGASVRLLLTTPTSMSRALGLFASPRVVSLAAMAGRQGQPDRKALRRNLADEVKSAAPWHSRPLEPVSSSDDSGARPRGRSHLMALHEPVTYPGERDHRDLPVSRYVNQPGYFF